MIKLIDLLLEATGKTLKISYWRPPGTGPERFEVYDDDGKVYFSGDEKHVYSLIAQVSDVGLDKAVSLVKNSRGPEQQSFKLNQKKWDDYASGK